MEWNALDWLDLVLRWFHVMAAISWIGGSLYLLWLDRIFANADRAEKGEHGEPWLIDLAGSLLTERLMPGPGGLAKTHIWFKRETTLTWVSGILLLVMVANLPGGGLLVGANGEPMDPLLGTAIIVVLLVLFWVIYDLLWRLPSIPGTKLPGLISYAAFVAAAWGLTQIFSGRAAFILIGAGLGTILLANVWLKILPALREMNGAREAGRPAAAELCQRARERSVHNSYLIFPTVILMLSNHYPVLYSHHFNWLVLALLAAAFIALRHVVVSGKAGVWALGPAAVLLAAAILAAASPSPHQAGAKGVSFAEARGIINAHCLNCHSTVPADRNFGPSPGGIAFDLPESIKRHAERIKVRAVDARTMPNRHDSGMTTAERETLGRWVNEGAKLE